MGHRSPSHQWDVHKHNWILLIPVWTRGTVISLRVLHEHLLLHKELVGEASMHQGRRHGLQAGTSGTQGHVYAITPQAEIPD